MPGYIPKPTFPVLDRSHPLAQGLKGAWGFYEGGGAKLYDLVNKNDGDLTSMDPATDWIGGAYGHALNFNGTDDFMDIGPDAEVLLGITDWPVSLVSVFKIPSTPSSAGLLFGVWKSGDPTGRGFGLGYQNTTWTPIFQIRSAAGTTNCEGTTDLNDGKYHVLVGVIHTKTNWRVYLDGVEENTETTSKDWPPFSADAVVTHGRLTRSSATAYAKADISYNGIYNRGLSANEISWLSHNPFAMFEEEDDEQLMAAIAGGAIAAAYQRSKIGLDNAIRIG